MKKTSLVIMAAGMGSRYGGGIKQIDPIGPSGEIILDYSVHDALRSGFNKVVFIIRRDLEKDFRDRIGKRIEGLTEVEYAFQELGDIPEGFSVPEGRVKPWGTGHAVLAGRNVIKEPFCVINADDYYGREGFHLIHNALVHTEDKGTAEPQAVIMAAFAMKNTLSDNGGVTRGILEKDEHGLITGIRETKNIIKTEDGPAAVTPEGMMKLDGDSLVSMNMWGLQPSFVEVLFEGFRSFLADGVGDPLTGEYLLPDIIDRKIADGSASVEVLRTGDTWFGVTYKEDRDAVRGSIEALIKQGVYTSPLS
ncbi:MAG: nucleotidyltransferase [Lachnospiraceae bacterium]|nr:nucleotidyltransferase [Lachnospiraceae bacterium]